MKYITSTAVYFTLEHNNYDLQFECMALQFIGTWYRTVSYFTLLYVMCALNIIIKQSNIPSSKYIFKMVI